VQKNGHLSAEKWALECLKIRTHDSNILDIP
jgi:hypothetical protein